MKALKNLRETESQFCERLCLPAHNLGEVNVPTKEQLKELEANVQYLQKEQVSSLLFCAAQCLKVTCGYLSKYLLVLFTNLYNRAKKL